MLLNLVRVRYGEAPVFIDVASVVGAYSLEGDLKGIGEYALPGSYMSGDRILRLEATGRYSDKPTITYHPLTGEKFAQSLMTPIPVSSLLGLIQSGYPADAVMRATVVSVNGHFNSYRGPGNPHAGSAEYRELLDAIRQAQMVGDIGFRVVTKKQGNAVVMFTRRATPGAAARLSRIYNVLELNPKKSEFTVVAGVVPDHDVDIAVLARSMFQVMTDYSSYIDVPQSDIASRRAYDPLPGPVDAASFPPLIKVRTGALPPKDAYVAIRHRSIWFWIEDNDYPSKFQLTFLMMLFSLTESGNRAATPLITIPAR